MNFLGQNKFVLLFLFSSGVPTIGVHKALGSYLLVYTLLIFVLISMHMRRANLHFNWGPSSVCNGAEPCLHYPSWERKKGSLIKLAKAIGD